MSYIFSRALVAASSPGKCSDIDASALSSGNPMPQGYSSPDKTTALSRLSRFGMTFKPLTADLGAELLTSWLGAFPVKTSALPAKAQALPEPAAECGVTWRASLAKFDPASSSWKTVQLSLLGDSELSLVTWPRSGMTAAGQCWELPMLGRRTAANDFGLSGVPTPRMTDWKNGQQREDFGMNLPTFAKQWPTPTVCGNYNRKGASATSGDGLATAVRMFHTPNTGGLDGGSNSRRAAEKRGEMMPGGGSLNPKWVEWLMGWPLGWTDLKPLATDRCLNAQRQHFECLSQSLEVEA